MAFFTGGSWKAAERCLWIWERYYPDRCCQTLAATPTSEGSENLPELHKVGGRAGGASGLLFVVGNLSSLRVHSLHGMLLSPAPEGTCRDQEGAGVVLVQLLRLRCEDSASQVVRASSGRRAAVLGTPSPAIPAGFPRALPPRLAEPCSPGQCLDREALVGDTA